MPKEKFLALEKKVKNLTLLYVEDNKGLQEQAGKVFKKIFKNVISADNGEDALELFEEHQPEIVITDINMGKLNGLELSKEIKKIDPFVKIIITSAFDDKDYLFEAIDANISKYLKKPITISELTNAITKVVNEIEFERNRNLFQHYIKDVFQHQETMLILLKDENILIVNKKCLEFFSQKSLDSFRDVFLNFDKLILKHNNFLYNHDDIDWLESAKCSNGKLFNVKMADKEGNSRHFILKAYKIPDKEETYILSFDDITDLNLLVIYDKEAMKQEKQESQKKIIYGVLEIVKRNNSNIKIYNSYKGLNISNIGILGEITEDDIVIQAPYMQLRAIKINNSLVIESELFPTAVLCDVKKVDFENSQVIIKNYKFIDSMPSEQEFTRVEPEENHKISLFFEGHKIHADVKILDVSVGGVKITMSLLPAGFKVEDDLVVDMVFTMGAKPLIINTKAKVKKLIEGKKEFVVILLFDNDTKIKKLLTEYVANRQMALIREFKKLAQEL
ncbi:MAG: hypothetical protein A2513_08340 [Sulfurimonas sp. RIFOXYD12_FULL_33_39]|uniref:response regulator n=1 Tax=unclassified Sulfurimonas TaxID=2623549 RepID=UPI0008BC83F4|nr:MULTISPECIES: response regulator [unclassified Sulfurimonas]OHE10095.1 MAG: hypothetical protein A2513_08340 [Sulfurimonas sp. RIFOXYD12_FULL_33_39]OHE14684.1 MAG: hypothetical protein A2530_02140 [Sulfurimonas sp. RIFOXYD2_FULL_34_21]